MSPARARSTRPRSRSIPSLPEAHQGMAWVLGELGLDGAEEHRRRGFAGRSLVTQPYRGTGRGVPLVLLVSARGGNIPTRLWIDDRRFTIHAIYADYFDPDQPLPPHALVMNAIGDADLCAARARTRRGAAGAQHRAHHQSAGAGPGHGTRRKCAPPRRDSRRDRPAHRDLRRARRLESGLSSEEGLEVPAAAAQSRLSHGTAFRVTWSGREALAGALAALEGEELLAIEYLDARGADGMARKYRVDVHRRRALPAAPRRLLRLEGALFQRRHGARRRASARRSGDSCDDMPGVLGPRAMRALERVRADARARIWRASISRSRPTARCSCSRPTPPWRWCRPRAGEIWDYRRAAIETALQAARRMLETRAGSERAAGSRAVLV